MPTAMVKVRDLIEGHIIRTARGKYAVVRRIERDRYGHFDTRLHLAFEDGSRGEFSYNSTEEIELQDL